MPPFMKMMAFAATTTVLLNQFASQYLLASSYTLTAFTLLLTQFTAWLVYWILIYPYYLSPLLGLPEPPAKDGSLFMGHSRRIMAEPSGLPARDWANEVPNDGIIRYKHWFNAERLLLTKPKTLGEVLVTKNYEFVKPFHFRAGLGRILGIGILLAEGDEHKTQRKNLMPAFQFRHIKDLYSTFWDKSREMVVTMSETMASAPITDEKPDNHIIEVGDWTSRTTLDIIGVAGLGRDFGALKDPNNALAKLYRSIFDPPRSTRYLQLLGVFLPGWIINNIPIARNKELNAANAHIKQVCRDLVVAKKAKMEKGERNDFDILSVALESGGFTDEDLVNQMMTFLVAGHETTSTAMTWAIYTLCQNPAIQTRLREEITTNLPSIRDSSSQVTSTDLDACHYLHAVCNEVLRLWAPVSMTMRVAANDSTINGQFVPKGTMVILAPWATNVNRELWGDDAAQFNPDRWMAEGQANKGGAESNYSFLTFLHGPRSCIGLSFAKAEFACMLAAWVGRFVTEFRDEDFVPEIKGGVTAKPKGGLWVKITENENW